MSLPYRIVIAAVVAVFLIFIIPPFFHLVGFPLNADLWLILRACIAAGAVFYAVTGRPAIT